MRPRFFKIIFLTAIIVLATLNTYATPAVINGQEISYNNLEDFANIPPHPRILLKAGEEKRIAAALKNNPQMQRVHEAIIIAADEIIPLPTLKRIKKGKRLLDTTQDILRRVFFLSYAYRMTGNENYAKRAEEEMLAASNFKDWNPSHFLDTAEATMALAIGLDWLDAYLPAQSKNTIAQAIINKGLKPSLQKQFAALFSGSNNWNSVCNAGLAYGALAVWDIDREISAKIIARAINSTPKVLKKQYAPNGAYPEGYLYWCYGTTFQAMLSMALENAFGSDFGLSAYKGFAESAQFIEYAIRPSGKCFNFADCPPETSPFTALFYLAKKLDDTSSIYTQLQFYDAGKNFNPPSISMWENRNKEGLFYKTLFRTLPIDIIYGCDVDMKKINPPTKKIWVGLGENPIAMVRTNWKSGEGIYLGIKGGKGNFSHAHLDAGSFVFDANGIDWACDLGTENYGEMEARKINIWDHKNGGDRWSIFRYNNRAHNTITIDNDEHISNGFAQISEIFDTPQKLGASVDMTKPLGNKVKYARRNAFVVNEKFAKIEDSVESGNEKISLRWNMCTFATPILNSADNSIKLVQNGKSLLITFKTEAKINLKTWPTKPSRDFENQNVGAIFIGFECEIPPNTKCEFSTTPMPLYE